MDDQAHGLPDPVHDFNDRAETYHRFMLLVKWVLIAMAATLMFLVLYFATTASFLGAFVAGAVIFGAGVWAMRHGLAHSSERENGMPPRVTH